MSLINQIEEMQKKVNNYDRLKEEHDRLKKEVAEALSKLNLLIANTSAFASLSGTKKYGSIKQQILSIYDSMKEEDNLQVTQAYISSLGLFKEKQVYYIMRKLMEMPDVETVKDGRRYRLFYRKKPKMTDIKFEKTSFMG